MVQASTRVGVAEVAGVEVWIAPKIDIRRLLFLLGYTLDPKGWRDTDVELGPQPELMPALVHAFCMQAERATQQGLLQGYQQVEDSLPVLRGRLRESEQLRRRFGHTVPVEVSYDDFRWTSRRTGCSWALPGACSSCRACLVPHARDRSASPPRCRT
jgi:5-methylcytosine-specific restriction enzyme subunit McrC